MKFQILSTDSQARAGALNTAHSLIQTPAFMPVGTQAAIKSLDAHDMQEILGAKIILANTYHLYLRPGSALVHKLGGLHNFTKFQGSFLTDSGGFQAFSLNSKAKVDENGITFKSHIDGSKHYFTPKSVLDTQYALNSDIMMILDDLVALPASPERIKLSINRTLKWAQESLNYHKSVISSDLNNRFFNAKEQNIFAIIQGGVDKNMRKHCASELCAMHSGDKFFDGLAIGGLSVGESAEQMYETIEATLPYTDALRPRYLMGVGTPENLVENIARGVDMFDCVLPTRNARNGTLFTSFGKLSIKNARFKDDESALDSQCQCYTCARYSRAYLHHLFRAGELSFYRLASLHNLHYYLNLMHQARKAIIKGEFSKFYKDFYAKRVA